MTNDRSLGILILCTANVCRSPVAEAMFRELCPGNLGVDVLSRGTHARPGIAPHPLSIQTAAMLGYKILPTRGSAQISGADVDAADLILVMEHHHKATTTTRFPAANGRIFLLGQWGQGEIADPIGGSPDFFLSVAKSIEESVRSWVRRIYTLGVGSLVRGD